MDDKIAFQLSKSNAELVKAVRMGLDEVPGYRITHPDPTVWDLKQKRVLLRAIIDLLETVKFETLESSQRGRRGMEER